MFDQIPWYYGLAKLTCKTNHQNMSQVDLKIRITNTLFSLSMQCKSSAYSA